MIKKEQRFFAELAISSPPQRVNFVKPRSLVRTSRALVPNVPIIIPKNNVDKSLIHVCFALYDGTKTYSRFTGTAMLSLFENTKSKVMIHLLHDNTLTDDNRDKLMQIVERYGQQLKFYNVEELCADRLAEINNYFPQAKESHFSIATFYRFFIPDLLLPQGIEKAIYLDSDIVVNLDMEEFWQIELSDKPLGVVPEIDNDVPVRKVARLVFEDVIPDEIYFNAGILLMNLKVLHNEEATILAGMKFVSEYPSRVSCFDQDILNYCFAASSLRLPIKFNRYVKFARPKNDWTIGEKIYHYADGRNSLGMDLNDPYNRLFMDYFIKTPWFDDDTRVALAGGIPSRKYHAVSVVIPMYNAEEYIGECLDSLLIQTFQDFEVIVVDDCSTDNSVEVVEGYKPKFGGRLKLFHTKTNSGNDCFPRNIGLMLARGEYVYFIDADDMILGNALEALYTVTILYDAEVVYTASWYILKAPNDIYLHKDTVSQKMLDTQKEFTLDDPNKNLSQLVFEGEGDVFTSPWTKLMGEGNNQGAWTKFVRRDFLFENKILFPSLLSGDFLWVINLYCHARRFLRISTPFYIYRNYNNNSMLRTIRPAQEQLIHWFSTFVDFAKALHELEKENEVLAANPLYRLATLIRQFAWHLNRNEYARKEIVSEDIYKILHEEFAKTSDDSLSVLLPFLFSFINKEEKVRDNQAELIKSYVEPINKFKRFLTARIDIKLMSTEGDFQILSVSDKKATVQKPDWFQKDGVGYIIWSFIGNLKIVAKVTTDGQINLLLRGMWVPDPNDKSKLIPYWIDYTKLTINEEMIFDTIKSAWCNKPYRYSIEAKADEEIVIDIDWLPHRSDIIDQKPATLPPKIENPIPDKFLPFITARVDIKLLSTEGDFQILSVSDNKATVQKPNWFQKDGVGYQIQSFNGELNLIAKATTNGKIKLWLRGLDVRKSEDWKKGIANRIPYWIDYTKLTVNEETIFDTITPTWCDKPYTYIIEAKSDEELAIKIEWQPHRSDA